MCGVFGLVVKKNRPADEVLAGLRDLEYRGYDSWGVAAADGSRLRLKKMVGPIKIDTLGFPDTDLAIGHTRWATNGGVTEANAHPHLNEAGDLAVVHNGIIENYAPLQAALRQKGHTFQSETDTEIVAHLYEEARRDSADPLLAFRAVWRQLTGLNAIVLLDLSARRLLFGRQGSPLAIGRLADGYAIASDGAALAGIADSAVYLEDGWYGSLSANELTLTSADGQVLSPVWQPLTAAEISLDDGRFPHRMLQEINEQPAVLARLASVTAAPFKQAALMVRSAKRVFSLGCGTAHYAGQVGFSLLGEAGVFLPAILANEAEEYDRFVDRNTVLIVLSQSGETIDILEPLARWQARGAKIVALVNSPHSTLDRMADVTLYLQAGREKSVASTKAFTAQLGALALLSAALNDHFPEGKRQLETAGVAAKKLLEDQEWLVQIANLARQLSAKPDIFTLGRSALRVIANEAALKIKEISYLHAEGMAAGELKHGTLALVDDGVPIILFYQSGQEAETETTARELKARGGLVIGVGPSRLPVFDQFIEVPDSGLENLVGTVLVAQLLAYQLAVVRGNNPDRPRNLAKSVTVK